MSIEHLYLHVPFCDGKCAYCGFYSVTADARSFSRYAPCPARELASLLSCPPVSGHPVELRTVYLGGGTPSVLGADALQRMIGAVRSLVSFKRVEEFTVEVNPADGSPAFFRALQELGVTRVSIGAQSFCDATLRRVGRRNTAAQIRSAIRAARAAEFADVGIDLIAGLPGVSPAEWGQTLHETIDWDLCHVSVYALAVEPGTRLAGQIARGVFPAPDDGVLLDAVAQAEERLSDAGFRRYEISNYARPGFECRHNLGVWRGEDYLGLGPAASSRVGLTRWTNDKDVDRYIAALSGGKMLPRKEETLSCEEDAVERVIFKFRLLEGVDMERDVRAHPLLRSRADGWDRTLADLAGQGIVRRTLNGWTLTSRGREVCDAVLRELE